MREIRFRARQAFGTNAGKWLFGSLILTSDTEAINEGYGAQIGGDHLPLRYVDLETVGQFTGLQDKNGKDIYEGDIVIYVRDITAPCDYHSGEPAFPEGTYTRRGHVTITTSMGVTLNGTQEFEPDNAEEKKETRKYNQNPNCWGDYAEVIGSIYENPELLK